MTPAAMTQTTIKDRALAGVKPYALYTAYCEELLAAPERYARAYPSVFLQRYARVQSSDGTEKPLILEPWQVFAVDDTSGRAVWVKPRQVGFSFLRAARALANALLRPNYIAVFVSYNRDEAKNKIIYARQLYESMTYPGKPGLKTDSMSELAFLNGSRIISFPAKAVRGYPQPDMFGDEWAFVPGAADIYSGSLSSGVRGAGTMTLASTPYGENNHFFDIYSNDRNQHPDWDRHRIEWWYSPAMCRDVPGALALAPMLSTAERVERFGSPKLQEIFRGLALEDFQREHESSFMARDDTALSRETLMAASQGWEEDDGEEVTQTVNLDEVGCVVANFKDPDAYMLEARIIPAIRRALEMLHDRSTAAVGFDVGRSDAAALVIVEEKPGHPRITRALIQLHGMNWPEMEAMLNSVAADRRVRRVAIDAWGFGEKLAWDVKNRFDPEGTDAVEGRVLAVPFGLPHARHRAFHAVMKAVQALDIRLYPTDDLFRHFAAFKREPESGIFAERFILERGRNGDGSRHHADLVVALGLALWDYSEAAKKNTEKTDDMPARRPRRPRPPKLWSPRRSGVYVPSDFV